MKGFATSPNPFTTGLKPRRFLSATKALMNYDIIINGTTKDNYNKIYKEKEAA